MYSGAPKLSQGKGGGCGQRRLQVQEGLLAMEQAGILQRDAAGVGSSADESMGEAG